MHIEAPDALTDAIHTIVLAVRNHAHLADALKM
jgi:hypothetical protein